VHDLFDIVTEAFIQWAQVQKAHIGEPARYSNGLQGVYSPGAGIWESDDDMVLIGGRMYAEFVAPCVQRIFAALGGGSVHFCGNGLQHVDALLKMKDIKVVNNSPLGKFDIFRKLTQRLGHRVTIQIQDGAPLDVEKYYTELFAQLDDFRGIMLAPFVIDNVRMSHDGGYVQVDQDPFDTANRIVRITRDCVQSKLDAAKTASG
jgi:hypothetical protein